jgi:hypothetical protein
VKVYVTDAFAVEVVTFNVAKNLIGFRNCRLWQLQRQLQGQRAVSQAAAGNLTHDERMHDHGIAFQQIDKLCIATAKMVDPDLYIDEY